MATVRNAGPMAVTPVGLLAIRWMGLWPSSAMVVALELIESNWLWMEARSTTTVIAICSERTLTKHPLWWFTVTW